MKKIMLTMCMVLLMVLFSACNKNKTNDENAGATATPSPQPIVTLPPEEVTDEDTTGIDPQENESTLKLQDYYPIQADTEYFYEGKENEYAAYTRVTDFVDEANNKVQTRTDNGGSETVNVTQIKDGKVSVIFTANECYYRDNFMDKTEASEDEVLLMEPLVKGTQWKLSDGSKRYISAIDVNVDTPSGKYKALEVTTEGKDSTTKDYYAPKVGLIKTVYSSGDMEVSSTLSKINTDTPFTQNIDIFYPDTDEKIYVEPLTLSFRTGDVTRLVLQEALRKEAVKESYLPLVSAKTKINSLYLGNDKIVYADFSADLVNDMNAGAGYETLILQSITNTLGNYYGVEKIYLTVAGKPYESGHVLMKKGETFKVDMSNVAR
ncbi:MAG: GerMN domain-containing protein [Herbinix sp.]|nr:GerMN domain-containing protein [Herbinix sp.]